MKLSIFAILIAGCSLSNHSFQPTKNDLDRVSKTLQQPQRDIHKTVASSSIWKAPTLSNTRIRFSDALALGKCGLVPLIAERNSALGKQKQESTQFIYEWKLIHGLKTCDLPIIHDEWFEEALRAKADDLKIAALLVLTKSNEAQEARSQRSVSLELSESMTVYRQAFIQIRQLILNANTLRSPPTPTQISQFESALREFASSHHHGRLGLAIRNTNAWLHEAVQIQLNAVNEDRICPMGDPTEQGRIVQAFVRGHFAKEILPKFAEINQAFRQLSELWRPVLEHNRLPYNFISTEILRINPNTFEQMTKQLKKHIALWQVVLNRCQLSAPADTTK